MSQLEIKNDKKHKKTFFKFFILHLVRSQTLLTVSLLCCFNIQSITSKNCPIYKNQTVFSPLPFRRLHSNNLHCDCHLSWLSDWLRARRGLAPFTQCMAPANMRGLNVPDVPKKDFVCNGKVTLTHLQSIGSKHHAEALLGTTNIFLVCFTSCFIEDTFLSLL